MNFRELSDKYEEYIIEKRRDFHRHPELSFEETRTSQIVCDELDSMGIPYERLDNNCVVGRIGKKGGKKIAIRADMDALPVTEERECEFKSENEGVMHACGHDGHTAMLLGTAKILSEIKDELEGEVLFCFQSAEEVGGGAQDIIEYLEKEGGVDQVIGAHLWSEIPSGDISLVKGARMAAGDSFTIEIEGVGGHGSRPDLSIDPIKPAANILLAISSIPTNMFKTIEPLVVHVGQLEAGTMGNIFPQKAILKGGIRSFSKEGREAAIEHIKRIVDNGSKMYGAKGSVEIFAGVPPVYNYPESVKRGHKVIKDMNFFELNDFEQICASENYGMFLEKYEGFMVFIGIRNEEKGLVYGQHHPKFGIDEDVLSKGSEFFARYSYEYLNE